QLSWAARSDPPRPPRVEVATPAAPSFVAAPDEAVELVLRARPAADGETVGTSWTVDGALAGEGERLELPPSRLGRGRGRALATGRLGSGTGGGGGIGVRPNPLAAGRPPTAPAPPPAPAAPPAA